MNTLHQDGNGVTGLTIYNMIQIMSKDKLADFLMEFRRMCERQDDKVSIKGIICKERIETWLSEENKKQPEEWEGFSIDILELKPKTYEALYAAGIRTMYELSHMRAYDLIKIPHIGESGVNDISERLEKVTGWKLSL